MKAYLVRIFLCLLTCALAGGLAAARTIEFETTQVTEADVALSPDGQWLIFTLLGHLFRLPVEGGTAEQLTFGPYYDTDPVFSPDGTQVAFVSDRDGSEGNIFVLELATGQITQVTRERRAGRPTWTPDGQAIVYLRFVPEESRYAFWGPALALVRRVALSGGEPETLGAPPRNFRSVFYFPDGRLAWAVVQEGSGSPRWETRIEVMNPQGGVSTLRVLKGHVDHVIASPLGDGLYCRRVPERRSNWEPYEEDLLFLPLPEGADSRVGLLPAYESARFAVAANNKSIYLGKGGRLWKVALPSSAREPIPFHAQVKLEIQDPVPPPQWAPAVAGSSAPPRSVVNPRLSPVGRKLVFVAAGHIWEQPLDQGPAQRLFEGSAIENWPGFSPDGRQLAFVHIVDGREEVRVFDFESQQVRTLASGASYSRPSWSRDGQRLVCVEYEGLRGRLVAINLSDGKKKNLTDASFLWVPRPHFSADGEELYFSANTTGTGALYRLSLKENAKPEHMTQLARHLSEGLISADGKWLAFRRGMGIWVALLGPKPVSEEHVHRLSPEGGDTFAFTPDSSALIYSVGNRVWRHPLAGGKREEIPVRLELQRPTPRPLLLRRVRVLDFPPKAGPPRADASGGFGRETSLYIEQGRIRWIGSEGGRPLPRDTITLDAAGRFAIPGLFDLHAHAVGSRRLSRGNQDAFLAYGVTSVRDTGGSWLPWQNALADRSETTSEPMPRYFFSGDGFEGARSFFGDVFLQIYDASDARAYVRHYKEWGAQFITVLFSLSGPLRQVVGEEARRVGLPLQGYATSVEEITKSVTLGYAVLEWTTSPNRPYEDVLEMLARAGISWAPTLAASGGNALLLRDQPERLDDSKLRLFTPEWRLRATPKADTWKTVGDKALRGSWVEQLMGIRAAYRSGVKLQAGTDAPASGSPFGASLHWELENLNQAGIPALAVLRIATQEAAAAVGAEDELGTLEPGKLADIVLLDKNPLEDIKNTQTIWRVIKGGWLFDPEKLRPPELVTQEN
ncbi:MAG: amidohydrolase family protein [Candidatus Acidoferrales bacterium]